MLLKIVFFFSFFFFTVFFYRLSRFFFFSSFVSILLRIFLFAQFFHIFGDSNLIENFKKKGRKKLRWKVDGDFFFRFVGHTPCKSASTSSFYPEKTSFFFLLFNSQLFFTFDFVFGTRNTRKKNQHSLWDSHEKKKMKYYTSYKKTNKKKKFSSLIESFRWKKFSTQFQIRNFCYFWFCIFFSQHFQGTQEKK